MRRSDASALFSARARSRARSAVLALVIVGVGAKWPLEEPYEANAEAATPAAIPVQIAPATRGDVPVYLTNLGTAQAYNTVTIRSRVDGELEQVLFKEGQDVKQDDLLALIDPRIYQSALDQAKGRLAQDSVNLANTKVILARDAALVGRHDVSQQITDNEQSAVAQLEAQVEQDKAAVSTAETQLSYTRIISPISGRAGLRLIDQGNIVHAQDAAGLVVINQVHPISTISALPEGDIPAVRAALAAGRVEVQALSRENGAVLDVGALELMDNAIEPASGTVRLKSVFPNLQDRLWPGQFIDVKVRVSTLKNALAAPAGAIQRGPDGEFVYVVGVDDVVATAPVRVGPIADGVAVIESGVSDGARIVTAGQYRIKAGVRVMATAPVPAK